MSSGYVDVVGGRLWYEEAGQGPSVLLLHAAAADSRMWDAQWLPFTARFHVVRLDLPGAGRSAYPGAPWSAVEHIERVLDDLGIGKAAMVGASLGGALAIDFVIERPQRAWALVAVSTGPRGLSDVVPDARSFEVYSLLMAGRPSRAAEMFIDVWCPLRTTPELDARLGSMVRDNIGMQVPEGLLRLPEWSAAERLGEIVVPTLAVWGDRDDRNVQASAARLAEGVSGARRVVLPGVDHFVPMRAADVFTREALAFLGTAAPST